MASPRSQDIGHNQSFKKGNLCGSRGIWNSALMLPKLLFVTLKGLAYTQVRSQEIQGTNDSVEIVPRQAEGLRSKNFHPQQVNSRLDYLYPNQHRYLPRLYSAVDI